MKGVLFFDIDNTLVKTDEWFEYSLKETSKILEQSGIGFSKEEIEKAYKNEYNEMKNGNWHYDRAFKKLGISEEKIPDYVRIILKKRKELKKEYYKFAMSDLLKTLKKLHKEYLLGIISQGTKRGQMEKLRMLGILELFPEKNIWITNEEFEKNNEFFKRLKKLFKNKGILNIWMIGDREDKDIIPAINAGFNAVRMYYGKYSKIAKDEYKNKIIFKLNQIFDHLNTEEMRI